MSMTMTTTTIMTMKTITMTTPGCRRYGPDR